MARQRRGIVAIPQSWKLLIPESLSRGTPGRVPDARRTIDHAITYWYDYDRIVKQDEDTLTRCLQAERRPKHIATSSTFQRRANSETVDLVLTPGCLLNSSVEASHRGARVDLAQCRMEILCLACLSRDTTSGCYGSNIQSNIGIASRTVELCKVHCRELLVRNQ